MNIVFMGTPEFAVSSLNKLIDSDFVISAVVTQPDRPNSRGKKVNFSPVKQTAFDNGLQVLQPEKIKDASFIEKLRSYNPDYIVVVAYGRILPKEILQIPKIACINLHASLLPKYRGAAPIHWAVIDGEKKSGATTMLMDTGMDTGDMLYKFEVEISNEMTTGELHDILARKGADLLIDTLRDYPEGIITPVKQDDEEATYTKMIDRDTGKIDWDSPSAAIHNLIRGTHPYPGAYSFLEGNRVKLSTSRLTVLASTDAVPGTIVNEGDEGIVVKTADGVLLIRELQFPGKKRMKVSDYIRGNGSLIGKRFSTLS
ncbi:methionyl-tRNA formyltransferase [Alkalibacter saccharofermentans]|uniref:Methionyl-tRNA formyltransferase n=1 Tax=Alkalibacter saccharofermentans DSM 14828 TaxID=1120975 RepID=A0A1M4S518_9FIRM|nr:methionyl-tRNA formyltransferase [Alkalibacter saccharofermentans]SHE27279.1 methionyl-tRNA formyltransferase [Alkalibacter saccharofermentans DSM 14828]